jgi:TatA/E family protein of Tat protein translocase
MFRWEDMLVILAVGLILFGPNKLVDFAKSLGTAFTEFKKAANPDGTNAQAAHATAQPALAHAAPARKPRKSAAKKPAKRKAARA